MNKDLENRRSAFAIGAAHLAQSYGLDAADVADSMLTTIIGIYMSGGLTETDLHNRVSVAWSTCEPMFKELRK